MLRSVLNHSTHHVITGLFQKSLLPIVFCGDFNTTPDKQVVKYLLNGKINATDSVWKMSEYTSTGYLGVTASRGAFPNIVAKR